MSETSSTQGRHQRWKFLFAALAAFSILYNISFVGSESISSGRVVVVALAPYFLLRGKSIYQQRDLGILLIFLPIPYVLAQLRFSGDFGQMSRFFHLALFSFLGANLVARLAGNLDLLLKAILAAISVQAIIIIVSFVNIDFRTWAVANVAVGSNFETLDIYRAPGLSSTGGSALSVVQSLGVLVGGLILYIRRSRIIFREFEFNRVLLQMLLCSLSCVFVGRIGLLLSAFFLLAICFIPGGLIRLMVLLAVTGGLSATLAVPHFEEILPPSFSSDFFIDYVFGFALTGSDESVRDLASMPIPHLGVETVFGTGLISALGNGANPSGHDSGFIQTYFSMGLIASILFYTLYAFVLLRLLRWLPLALQCLLAAIFFAIEVKEPYLFKYSGMFVLVSCYTLAGSQGLSRRLNSRPQPIRNGNRPRSSGQTNSLGVVVMRTDPQP